MRKPIRLLALCLAAAAALWPAAATGPLRVLASNPRYFTDGSGRAIYLAGSHNWHSLQDNGHRLPGSQDPPPAFDYNGYLDFLEAHHHNFFRLWRWEAPQWMDESPRGLKHCAPHPWMRTGPGSAKDDKPKFDLTRFDARYFDRLRSRIIAARDRGIYVSVMLFEGWESQFTDAWNYHPFNAPNNVNGIDGDAIGYYTVQKTEMGRRILALQEAYLRKVVDTVDDLDNVLYEVCNESAAFSTEWQYHVIDFVKKYEAGKPKQHPVGMTVHYRGGDNSILFRSPADWVSPNPGGPTENYLQNPSSAWRGKVIVNDTDHLCGHTCGDNIWVWRSFLRGLNVLFMEELPPSPAWQDSARDAMGQTVLFSRKVNLAEMVPSDALSGTRYCLANRGKEYLVFQDGNRGEFTVDLKDAPATFAVEWFDVNRNRTVAGKPVAGGAVRTFTTPFGGPAVLYLKATP